MTLVKAGASPACPAAGASGYLLKAERPEELFAAIHSAAQGRPALSAPFAPRVMAGLRGPRISTRARPRRDTTSPVPARRVPAGTGRPWVPGGRRCPWRWAGCSTSGAADAADLLVSAAMGGPELVVGGRGAIDVPATAKNPARTWKAASGRRGW